MRLLYLTLALAVSNHAKGLSIFNTTALQPSFSSSANLSVSHQIPAESMCDYPQIRPMSTLAPDSYVTLHFGCRDLIHVSLFPPYVTHTSWQIPLLCHRRLQASLRPGRLLKLSKAPTILRPGPLRPPLLTRRSLQLSRILRRLHRQRLSTRPGPTGSILRAQLHQRRHEPRHRHLPVRRHHQPLPRFQPNHAG